MSVTPKTLRKKHFCGCRASDPNEIDDVRGWLTVVTSRLCLDQVRSARARYERLSEPERARPRRRRESRRLDPADRVTLDDEVRTALMEVLRRLSPGERVAFVLHDVFGVPVRHDRRNRGPPGRHLPPAGAPGASQIHCGTTEVE